MFLKKFDELWDNIVQANVKWHNGKLQIVINSDLQ